MARQTEHQKAHITGRHRYGERESHAGKSKPSKTRVYKASTAISPPKNYRERTKKSVVVKPISKDDVRKLQHISKHARSSRISKHLQVPEPCLEPCGLSSAFHESLEGARSHILSTGKAAFNEAHAVLVQKFTGQKAKDHAFRENVLQNVQAISAPLINEKTETTVQRKINRPSRVVAQIGERVNQFKQTIENEENKVEELWKQYNSFQTEFLKFLTQVFGGEAIGKPEDDDGYRTDMKLLDAEHATQIKALLEELDEVGQEAIKNMKASEKDIDIKADKVRQRIVGAMLW